MKIVICFIVLCCWSVCFNETYAQNGLKRYDVVISEVMADPTPAIGLPVVEYIELHNRTTENQLLAGWKLRIGNTLKVLPTIYLDSAGYAIVIAQKFQDLYEPICQNIYTLSSLSLSDGGQKLVLYDNQDSVIHHLSYRKEWHSEPIKQDGGWSLEMKDDNLPCWEQENWDSSVDESGGTPGRPNSIQQRLEDVEPPQIERITLLDNRTIRLYFSEVVEAHGDSEELFDLSPHLTILKVTEVPPEFCSIDIQLNDSIQPNVLYDLSVVGHITDFAGNACRVGEGGNFGLPAKPFAGSIVINEVLAHPFDGTDADFIEIFNKSSNIIDLKDVKIGSGGLDLPLKAVSISNGYQLMPGAYCAICKNKRLTEEQYVCLDSKALLSCDSLPAFANTNGVVFLSTSALLTLDRFAYDESMHYSGLTSTEGVSLERVRFDSSTQNTDNWHSASSSVGFATPGFRNSQAKDVLIADGITLNPEVFSPDNDGFEDFTEFILSFDDHDNRLMIQIFSQEGAIVRHLVNNELCGTSATFRWDGTDDNGNLLPTGMYIAVIQVWNAIKNKSKRHCRVVSIRH